MFSLRFIAGKLGRAFAGHNMDALVENAEIKQRIKAAIDAVKEQQ